MGLVDPGHHERLVALAQRGRERIHVDADDAAGQPEVGVRLAKGPQELDPPARAREEHVDRAPGHSPFTRTRSPSKRGIVAWPSALTPSRRRTRHTLSTRTFASSHSDQ